MTPGARPRIPLRARRVAPLLLLSLSLSFALTAGCAQVEVAGRATAQPPVARVEPKTLSIHGDDRVDEYYWLRDRESPETIAYLEAENAYTEAETAHTALLADTLFEEIKGRIVQDDASVPYEQDGWWYYRRYEEGQEYPIYARKKGSPDAAEEILLDANRLAEGHEYFAARGLEVSSDGKLLAFAVDTVGRRIYTIRFRDLATGRFLADEVPGATANLAWAEDGRTLFYAKQDPQTLRSDRIYRHTIDPAGAAEGDDPLVYEETDDTFSCYVWKTKSKAYLMIGSYQTLSSEIRYAPADRPAAPFRVLQPRERDHEYQADHRGDRFYIRTNLDAPNFRLMSAPVATPGKEHWTEVVPHRADVLLESFELFRDFLVLEERKDGLIRLTVRPANGDDPYTLDFDEPAYLAGLGTNAEMDTPLLRYVYESMTTPETTYDVDMRTKERTLKKRERVLGDFDPQNYRTERLWAPARDGARVPISIVYPADFAKDGSAPLVLYGYGSYGISLDASFRSDRLSLLDRGFAYAIAHVRGGMELGRSWYEDGKLLKKKNTFTDFIDCARFLVDQGYTSPDRMFARGGSAGGLLIGAVVNMQPELFHGAVADVPFVDVVTTMLDDTIPLTTGEYDEWGNPADPEYYAYMLSYSPYDNVAAKDYPNLLVTTGLHDSQVQYWEPAKWVARMRARRTGDALLLLKTDMEAGHGGASGRFKAYREVAFRYAFYLDLAGLGS